MTPISFDASGAGPGSPGYRVGEAARVDLAQLEDRSRRVEISVNSTHALVHLGVVAELNRLGPHGGPIGAGRDVLFNPALLEDAAVILYEADRETYGREHEFIVGHDGDERPLVLRLDRREYQRTLSRLQFLVTSAARHGDGVRLRI